MQEQHWMPEVNRTLVCVDSYDQGVPHGRFYNSYAEMEVFESMSQFLLKMEESLNDRQKPQSYTISRTFSQVLEAMEGRLPQSQARRGRWATFEVTILFRQHTSWQGVVRWQEGRMEQSFRSVLELIRLMDSAMRRTEGSGLAV